MKPHERIWLQWEEHDFYDGGEVITWCENKINDSDVEYIRKDIYDKRNEEIIKDVIILDRNFGYEYLVPLATEDTFGPILDVVPEKMEYPVLVYRINKQIDNHKWEYKYQCVRMK